MASGLALAFAITASLAAPASRPDVQASRNACRAECGRAWVSGFQSCVDPGQDTFFGADEKKPPNCAIRRDRREAACLKQCDDKAKIQQAGPAPVAHAAPAATAAPIDDKPSAPRPRTDPPVSRRAPGVRPAGPQDFAAWTAAHRNLAAETADIKARTAALIAADPQPAPRPPMKNSTLKAAASILSDAQKEAVEKLSKEAVGHWRATDFDDARIGFVQVLGIDPANGPAYFYMGDMARRQGDFVHAAMLMERARVLAAGKPEGLRAAIAMSALPPAENPGVAEPPRIWLASGTPTELWDAPQAPQMVVLPAGEFTMGSPVSEPLRQPNEGLRHRVRIAYPLAVSRYPVTVAQFAAFVSATGYVAGPCATFEGDAPVQGAGADWRRPGFAQGDDSPVVCVNWDDAMAYAAWLSKATGQPYRLLTEAEYEYADRAATTTAYWWGAKPGQGRANCDGCLGGWDAKGTSPAGSFAANPFGLYDTAGNVWSWTQDCYAESYAGANVNGAVDTTGDCRMRVLRGGSWNSTPDALRSSFRFGYARSYRSSTYGFRVARGL